MQQKLLHVVEVVQGLKFRVLGSWFRVLGLWSRVQGLGLSFHGLRFRNHARLYVQSQQNYVKHWLWASRFSLRFSHTGSLVRSP